MSNDWLLATAALIMATGVAIAFYFDHPRYVAATIVTLAIFPILKATKD